MTRNERQRDLVQTLNGATINLDRVDIDNERGVVPTINQVLTSDGKRFKDPNSDFGSVIQNAIDHAEATDGVHVMLPPGETPEYTTTPVLTTPGTSIIGTGKFGTRLLHNANPGLRVNGASRWEIRGIHFDCTGSTADQDNLELDLTNANIAHFRVNDCRFSGPNHRSHIRWTGDGNGNAGFVGEFSDILFNGCTDDAYHRDSVANNDGTASVTLRNIHSQGNDIGGSFIHDAGTGQGRRYMHLRSEPNVKGTDMFYLRGGSRHTVRDNKFESTDATNGVHVIGVTRSAFDSNWVFGPSSHAWYFDANYRDNWFNLLHAASQGGDAVRFENGGTVSGNMTGRMPDGFNDVAGAGIPQYEIESVA